MSHAMPAKAANRAARSSGRLARFAVRNGVYLFLAALVIVSGLVSGALYALVASGLSLVWGALGVFN